MQIAGVWVTTLRADDVAASVRWYREVLGLWPPDDDAGDPGDPGDAVEAGDQRLAFSTDAATGAVLSFLVGDLDAALAELRAAGTPVGDPVPDALGRGALLHDPAGNPLRLYEPAPTDRAERLERELTSFIEGQAELAGAPTEQLADEVAAIVGEAQQRIRQAMSGVAHNKVLATQLLVSQQARQCAQGSTEQWRLFAASTLLSDLIVPR